MSDKNYTLTFDKNNYATVSSVNYLRMEEYLDEVKEELIELKYDGRVLFDLLLCNGFQKNRFISLDFKNNQFNIKSCIVVIPDDKLIIERNDFYRKNSDLLENSHILSESQSFLLLKGKDLLEKHY